MSIYQFSYAKQLLDQRLFVELLEFGHAEEEAGVIVRRLASDISSAASILVKNEKLRVAILLRSERLIETIFSLVFLHDLDKEGVVEWIEDRIAGSGPDGWISQVLEVFDQDWQYQNPSRVKIGNSSISVPAMVAIYAAYSDMEDGMEKGAFSIRADLYSMDFALSLFTAFRPGYTKSNGSYYYLGSSSLPEFAIRIDIKVLGPLVARYSEIDDSVPTMQWEEVVEEVYDNGLHSGMFGKVFELFRRHFFGSSGLKLWFGFLYAYQKRIISDGSEIRYSPEFLNDMVSPKGRTIPSKEKARAELFITFLTHLRYAKYDPEEIYFNPHDEPESRVLTLPDRFNSLASAQFGQEMVLQEKLKNAKAKKNHYMIPLELLQVSPYRRPYAFLMALLIVDNANLFDQADEIEWLAATIWDLLGVTKCTGHRKRQLEQALETLKEVGFIRWYDTNLRRDCTQGWVKIKPANWIIERRHLGIKPVEPVMVPTTGAELKKLRMESAMTQEEFAEDLGVSRQTLLRAEKTSKKKLSVWLRKKLGAYLND